MVVDDSAEMELPPLSLVAWLQPLVDAVVRAQFGASERYPNLEQSSLASSAPLIIRKRLRNAAADRFLIAIPFAEDCIYCHLLFCYQNPSQFPRVMVLTQKPEDKDDLEELEDVGFDPFRFRKHISNIPGSFIPVFNYDDSDSLLSLLRCMTSEFGQYQRRKLLHSGHSLFTDFLTELRRPILRRIDENTEIRAYEVGKGVERVAVVSHLTVINKEKTSMINMKFKLVIVISELSAFNHRSNISVVLNRELENLLVAFEPPKMGELSLIEYFRHVQEDIGQMIQWKNCPNQWKRCLCLPLYFQLHLLSVDEPGDDESKESINEETTVVASPYEDCYMPDDPRLRMRWGDFRAK